VIRLEALQLRRLAVDVLRQLDVADTVEVLDVRELTDGTWMAGFADHSPDTRFPGFEIGIQQDSGPANLPRPVNFVICNNVLSVGSPTQLLFRFRCLASNSLASDFVNFGICDNNAYSSPFSNLNLFSTQVTGGAETFLNFPTWQSTTRKDANSTVALPVSTSYGIILKSQNRPDFLS